MDDLRGMWRNVATSLKPGGKFLGIRVQNVRAGYLSVGKYGVKFTEVEEIPGGLKYTVECLTQPPFSFGATSMESTYSLSDDVAKEFGMADFHVVPPEDTDLVRSDKGFWDDFLKNPAFTVIVGRKLPTQE